MNAMLPRLCLVLFAIAACCVVPRAWAAASGDNCTVTVTGVNFGAYDPTSGVATTGQGQFQIDCNKNDTEVLISLGTGGSGSYASRRMTTGSDLLNYNLYLEPSHATIFGDGSGGSSTVMCMTGAGNNQNGCTGSNPSGSGRRTVRPFFGLMPASQNVGPGLYTDTVTYTITF
jgi:spore coat protein U-like protein